MRSSIWKRGGATLVLIALALFTTNAAPAVSGLSIKACELLTVKDIQGVLGDGYTPQEVLSNEIMSLCGYTKGKGDAVSLGLKKEFYGSAQVLKMEQEGIKQQGRPVTPVSGLGEGAYYRLEPGNDIFQLNFGKGHLRAILTVMSGGKPNVEAALKLAKIVYSKMQ